MINPHDEPAQNFPLEPTAPLPAETVLPGESIFLEVDEESPVSAAVAPEPVPQRGRRPEFWFWESVLWVLGFLAVQLIATLLAAGLVMAAFILPALGDNSQNIDQSALVRTVTAIFESHVVTILGVAQFGTILYGLLAIRIRFGKSGLRDLGFQRPWTVHWILVVLLMFPLWLLCSMLQNLLFQWFPNSHDAMQQVLTSMSQAPLSLLVLVVGFGPAISEELMFRGMIGRGLVARQGLVMGMLTTSILFGVMHLNPGQALAVIPIGLAMHFVYYTTRSFWAPMTLHLLNNSLSVFLLKNGSHPTVQTISQALEQRGTHYLPMLVASVAMVTAIVILLWQTRVQFVLTDGTVWDPGYTTTAAPPPELGAVPVWQEPRLLMLAGGTFNSLGFAAGVWRLADWAGLPW